MADIQTLVGLDPSQIKDSLKEFLQDNDTFKDYNFEGSALSTIIDLLTRNTYYMVYLANMLANECTIDTAQLRETVVSHARKLNYVPKSKIASNAVIDLLIKPVSTSGLANTIVVPQNKQLITNFNNKVYTFVTNKDYTAFKNSDNNYVVKDVKIYQGSLIKNSFTKTVGSNIFVIPNSNIDITTLRVYVKGTASSNSRTLYSKVIDITNIDGESEIYFLYENSDGLYQLEFGDNVLGRALTTGNVIEVEYIDTTDSELVNGAEDFTMVSSISGYTDIDVTTVIPANGGAEKEDIEKIRTRAPRLYTAQNRAVTARDYAILLLNNYPAVKDAHSWGGEENPEPSFGKVFIAVVPNQGFVISQTVKDSIVDNILKPYNVGSITPVILDSKAILLDLDISITVDNAITEFTITEMGDEIIELAKDYSELILERFDSNFIRSKFEKNMLDNLEGLSSINTEVLLRIEFTPEYGSVQTIDFEFANEIKPNTVEIQNILVQGYTLDTGDTMFMKDDGKGNIDLYKLIGGTEERVLNLGVGTVNYETGDVIVNKINLIYDSVVIGLKTPYIKAEPVSNDISSIRQFVLYLNNINVS